MLAARHGVAVGHQLLQAVSDARRRSDALFRLLDPDSFYERPIPERHRIIFYLGHLEAFDWNLLYERALGLKAFHPEFDRLFAFGIDPVGGGLPSDQPPDWPFLSTVQDYVGRTRSALDERLSAAMEEPSGRLCDGVSLATLVNVAVEHRLMHLETLAYMLHQLPFERKHPPPVAPDPMAAPVVPRMVEIAAGVATLGLSRGAEVFGWDNEYEVLTAHVPEFGIDEYMVTNRQYLDFMMAGGYETRAFWSDEDWDWKTDNAISSPVFWRKAGEDWLFRTMFEDIPLPPDWPVYVSHAEAAAYARWAGKSLPTEEEWHRAAYGAPDGGEHRYPWGEEEPNASFGNFDFQRWNPAPVSAFPQSRSAFGVQGMLGNGWEWTSTVFAPFPGFEPFAFYRGYSADFFDGKHFVMKGGSARTAACMLRPTFRNWFQAHYQYVYAGFRCVNR